MNINSMADFQNRAKFLSSQSVILVKIRQPLNRFQEEAVNIVSCAMHGVVFDTEGLTTIKDDIVRVIKKLDSKFPRKHKHLEFLFSESTSDPLGNCDTARLMVFDSKCNEATEFMSVWFMPLHGIGDYSRLSGGSWHCFVVPFKDNNPAYGWVDKYNDYLFSEDNTNKKGGAK